MLFGSSPQWSHSNSTGTCVTSWHQSWLEYNGEAATKCRRWLSKQSNLRICANDGPCFDKGDLDKWILEVQIFLDHGFSPIRMVKDKWKCLTIYNHIFCHLNGSMHNKDIDGIWQQNIVSAVATISINGQPPTPLYFSQQQSLWQLMTNLKLERGYASSDLSPLAPKVGS